MKARRQFPCTTAAVALIISLATLACSQLPSQSSRREIPNFGKVNDHYYRGSRPNEIQIEGLRQLGVRTVIDLTKDFNPRESKWVEKNGMKYFLIPLTTREAATAEQTSEFLRLANDPKNWPVYVHCKGGRHRTGEMTAIYRITNDNWTADQAYEEMKKYDFESGWLGGPDALKKYVYRFYEQNKKESAAANAPK
jgi:protein tyrosine/serine phosphatase